MADRNIENFQGRLGRIERTHLSGGGFEAEGTLGMSYYSAQRQRRRTPRWPGFLLVTFIVLIFLKAGLNVALGAGVYEEKIEALRQGDSYDRAGAWVLQADPVTLALAERIRAFMR